MIQLVVVGVVVAVVVVLGANLFVNMQRLGLPTDWSFCGRPAGFRIPHGGFRSSDSVCQAFVAGAKNTLLIAIVGIVLATIIGVVVGIARLSTNWLVRRAAGVYVETLRNIPPLVIIIFWSTAVILQLPRIERPSEWLGTIVLSNRGLWILGYAPGAGGGRTSR